MHRLSTYANKLNGWHKIAILFFLVLLLFLSLRADDEYRWSDWGFGDAQTMLSLNQWQQGGWIRNYLLFKPQGYAKNVDLLDEADLRHHAHGTCPGSSPRIGPRLWYTHYPAGYLIPYAILFRIGIDGMFPMRLLSIVFSLGALGLMYALFARLTSPRVSFLAVLFYGLSSSFLGYADSLANQPLDDLLRFGFMLAVVLSTRALSEQHRKRWMIAAWVMEFSLSLASFDSVFFLYVWLIGWDVLERRRFRWKTYAVFALAPITAHGLQFLQNVWYLGWHDAVIDIKDAFLLKNGADAGYNAGQGRFGTIIQSFQTVFQNVYAPAWLLLAVLGLYLLFHRILSAAGTDLPSPRLLALLLICGTAFVVALPHAARMPYEARQMIPFASLLASGFTWSFLEGFRRSIHHEQGAGAGRDRKQAAWLVSYLLVAVLALFAFWFRFVISDRHPVYTIPPDMTDIPFAQMLRTFPAKYEPVFFDRGGFHVFWDPTYVPGYPQILPLTEYYAGSRPILCFSDAEKTAKDIAALVRKSPSPFSPVVIADSRETLDEIILLLQKEGVYAGNRPMMYEVMDRYVIDLTDNMKWGGS